MTREERIHNQAERAMREAVRKLVADARKLGRPLFVWKDGKVVRIPAKRKKK